MIQRGEQMHKSTPPGEPLLNVNSRWFSIHTPNIIIDQLRTNGHVLTTHIYPQGINNFQMIISSSVQQSSPSLNCTPTNATTTTPTKSARYMYTGYCSVLINAWLMPTLRPGGGGIVRFDIVHRGVNNNNKGWITKYAKAPLKRNHWPPIIITRIKCQ